MMRLIKTRTQHREGSATVEFAIVLPVFLLLVGGMIEFGQLIMLKHSLTSAARLGARRAIITGNSDEDIEILVKTQCQNLTGIEPTFVTVGIKATAPDGSVRSNLDLAEKGDACEVKVEIPINKATVAFFSKVLTSTSAVATCVMEHE